MQAIVNFLQNHYSDEKLAALLAHAEDGKLSMWSCCCFVGIPTARHALNGELGEGVLRGTHLDAGRKLSGAYKAETEFFNLGNDRDRRAKLIPLIREEIARREQIRARVGQFEEEPVA
jgi:hypothetical protein